MDVRAGSVWLALLLLLPACLSAQPTPERPGPAEPASGPTSTEPGFTASATGSWGSSSAQPPSEPPPPSDPPAGTDWTPADAFLFSRDPSAREAGACVWAYSLAGRGGGGGAPLPGNFRALLRPAMDALANAANFLNMIFQASDLRESSVREDMEWYHALVRSLLEADPRVRRALLAFDADPASPAPQLLLRASRGSAPNPANPKVRVILLQDLSDAWERMHPPAVAPGPDPDPAPDDSWFSSFKFPSSGRPSAPALWKRVLLNDLSTLDTPKWGRGDSYVTNRSAVRWGDAPFLECEDGRLLPGWLLTLSASFYGLKPDLTPEFRGVVRVDVNIQDFDVDQCAPGDAWFSNTHQCNRTSMTCEPITGQGFQLGQYCCRCKEGYYSPPQDGQAAQDQSVNGSVRSSADGAAPAPRPAPCPAPRPAPCPAPPLCLPCWPGCAGCRDGAPCWVQEAARLRVLVLALQGLFMLLLFLSMMLAYRFRRSRRIRASGLLLLETILFGSLLLYFPVFILYFKPSTFRCILLRWVRMLGFTIAYGTLTLKMYRVLKVFLSRTAQRVPYMSSLHLLRLLGVMLLTVTWFLSAWTAGALQNRHRNVPLLVTSATPDGQLFTACHLDRWDYMMAVAELLFLCWGSLLCRAVKPVPSAFHEPRYMGLAIHNELLLSSTFHLLRFAMPSLHPDWMLLLFFSHTHVTVTVTLGLLFVPKFIHVSRPGREEIAAEVYEDEVDLRRSGSDLNSSFTSWNEHSLDPDDIRDELKKLYSQLEIHKTKKMTSHNPHIQKKRSSRCRSIIRRITEIPESMSRQCSSREDKEFRNRSPSQASYKRSADTISVNYSDEPVPRPSPILRKSQSEHDYAKDKDSSLHDSMMRANLAKRASQRSDTDSLDIGPLVCKSASAHNLTVDNNLLHPDHHKLFKSLSLTSSKAHSLEDTSRAGRAGSLTGSIKDQTTSALQSQSFDKAEVCPWELEEQRPAEKTQKHVTYAPCENADASVNLDIPPVSQFICPWDHVPDPPPPEETAASKDGVEGECESPRPHFPISCSVPSSPMPNPAKEQRMFSFRSPAQKWLSVKSFVGSVDGSPKVKIKKEGSTKEKAEDSVSQKSQESGGTGTRLTIERKAQQKRSMTIGDMKPCLVKQTAVRLSSGDSTERSPRKIVFVKSALSPWDAEDTQKDGMYENVFISRQNSMQSDTSRTVRTPSAHRRGSNRITPALSVSHADDSPRGGSSPRRRSSTIADVAAGVLSQRKQSSAVADICPWDVQEGQATERASVCPWESEEVPTRQESVRVDVCPWESQDVPATPNTSLSHQPSQQKTPQIHRQKTDICPWETVETPENLKRPDVCPWDVDESSIKVEAFYENVRPEIKVLNKAREGHKTEQVCPWDSEDMSTNSKQDDQTKRIPPDKTTAKISTTPKLLTRTPSSIEACPWEFPDPPQNLADICPWEEESPALSLTKPATKEYSLNETTAAKTDVCPWESGDQDRLQVKDSAYGNICPWEIDEPKTTDSGRVDVCPWETGNTEGAGQQEADVSRKTEKTIIADRAKNCQVTGDPEKRKGNDSVPLSVCPWEAEEPAALERSSDVSKDVCPWDTEEPRRDSSDVSKGREMTKGHNSAPGDVCPWDTEEPDSVNSVCPWETASPATAGRRDSVQNAVSKLLENKKSQDSNLANICPWEAADPENTGRRESVHSLVSKLQENKKRQDSTNADVCPWETDEAGTKTTNVSSTPQTTGETSQIESCQLETEEPARGTEEVMKTQASRDECGEAEGAKANAPLARRDALCPWATEGGTKPGSISENDNASDVFTWDPDDIPEEDEEADALCAAEAFVFPDDL